MSSNLVSCNNLSVNNNLAVNGTITSGGNISTTGNVQGGSLNATNSINTTNISLTGTLNNLTLTNLNSLDTTSSIQTQLNSLASASNVVDLVTNQTVGGVKTFTSSPVVPTCSPDDNSTNVASTSYVDSAISALASSAPSTLSTLNELATALGDNPNFATTITNQIAGCASLASGNAFTGTNSFSNTTTLTGSLVVNSQTLSPTILSYLSGCQSNLQTQLNATALNSAVVHNTTNEVINGVKTFNSAPILPANSISDSMINNSCINSGFCDATSSIQDQLNACALNTNVVHNSGNETIAGIKTFTSSPVLPNNSITDAMIDNTCINSGFCDGTSSIQTQLNKITPQAVGLPSSTTLSNPTTVGSGTYYAFQDELTSTITVTLPTSPIAGQTFIFRNSSSYSQTIVTGSSSQLVYESPSNLGVLSWGSNSFSLSPDQQVMIITDSLNYFVLWGSYLLDGVNTNIQNQISTTNTNLATTNTNLATTNAELSTANTSISNLQSGFSSINAEYNTLSNQVSENVTNIQALQSNVFPLGYATIRSDGSSLVFGTTSSFINTSYSYLNQATGTAIIGINGSFNCCMITLYYANSGAGGNTAYYGEPTLSVNFGFLEVYTVPIYTYSGGTKPEPAFIEFDVVFF